MIKAEIKRKNNECKCNCEFNGTARDIEIETSVFVVKVIEQISNTAKVDKNIIAASIIQKILIQIGVYDEANRNK